MSNILVGDGNNMATEHDFGDDCLNEFVQELADEITGSCMIPMNLPAAEVANIVKRARKWFYKKYEYSVQENFFVIPAAAFSTEYFKASRTINLPEGVYSIFGVHQTSGGMGGGDIDFASGDFSVERMFAGHAFGGGAGVTQAAESLEYYVINQKFFDLARQILENPLSFDYNRLNRALRFTGENPKGNVILEVYETISDCALYEDEIFFRYCAAKVKISLGSKLAIFDFQLPGNITVNADAIQSLGESELESVIEEINGDEGVDWMMHS